MKTQHIILIAAVAGGLLYMLKKKVAGASVAGAAQALGGAVVNVADGAFSGVVKGVGSTFLGIPDTDKTRCEQAKAVGNSLDASFYCAAGDFMSYMWGGEPQSTQSTTASNKRYEGAGASGGGSGSVLDWSLSSTGPSEGSFLNGLNGFGLSAAVSTQ